VYRQLSGYFVDAGQAFAPSIGRIRASTSPTT
jgi:hypothetical protein